MRMLHASCWEGTTSETFYVGMLLGAQRRINVNTHNKQPAKFPGGGLAAGTDWKAGAAVSGLAGAA